MVYVSQNISHFGYTADAFLNKIFQEYTQFIQGAQPEDDVTLVVIKTTQ